MELTTGENDKDRRLDRILRKALPEISLPLLYRLLRQKKVLVNKKPAKAQDRLDAGDKIYIPLEEKIPVAVQNALPDAYLDIIWQDLGLLAVNKPSGLEVHGKNSLETMVRAFLKDKMSDSLSFIPGPLHRLDKPTSGIVVFSASLEGARLFSSLLHDHKTHKTYLAIVEGCIEKEQLWEDELVRDKEIKKTFVSKQKLKESKFAASKVRPLLQSDSFSLVTVEIITGRTHQIRAQAAAHRHTLFGDKKYGSKTFGGFFLHAWKLKFLDIDIQTPPPEEFNRKVEELFRQAPPYA